MSEETIKITRLTVAVDKMPRYCSECPLMMSDGAYNCWAIYISEDGTNSSLGDNPYNMPFRRHDCPLIVEEADA